MSSSILASLLVGSSNVDQMKAWYRTAFDLRDTETGALDFGGIGLFIEEHSEISGRTAEPARIILNLDVDDCREIERRLRAADVEWAREVELQPFGLIGTVADPDGNLVQIIQWGAQE